MPVYEYKGLDAKAKSCTGVIDAETPRDAREKLRVKKIYVTDIDSVGDAGVVVEGGKAPKKKSGPSLFGRLGKGSGGLSLMSHDDVVPALPEQYKPKLTGGKLYGRGSCDMKGPLAATLCAAARFKDAELKKPLFIIVTADEEVQAAG